jgi:hypothetical protein
MKGLAEVHLAICPRTLSKEEEKEPKNQGFKAD